MVIHRAGGGGNLDRKCDPTALGDHLADWLFAYPQGNQDGQVGHRARGGPKHVSHDNSIRAGLVCLRGGDRKIRAVRARKTAPIELPLVGQRCISGGHHAEAGAFALGHRQAPRLRGDRWWRLHRQSGHRASIGPFAVGYHYVVRAGIGRLNRREGKRCIGLALHRCSIVLPLIPGRWNPRGGDPERGGLAPIKDQTGRLAGDGWRKLDGQRHHRAGARTEEVGHGDLVIAGLAGLRIEDGVACAGRAGNRSPVEAPLIAQGRRATGHDAERRAVAGGDGLALRLAADRRRRRRQQRPRAGGEAELVRDDDVIVPKVCGLQAANRVSTVGCSGNGPVVEPPLISEGRLSRDFDGKGCRIAKLLGLARGLGEDDRQGAEFV